METNCGVFVIKTGCALFYLKYFFFPCGTVTQRGSWPPHSWGFLDHTQWRTTVGRTPLDEWSARCRDLYLTTHNTYNRQTSMLPVGFEPTISAGERPQTYALDRATTGTGIWSITCHNNNWWKVHISDLSCMHSNLKIGEVYSCDIWLRLYIGIAVMWWN